MTGLTKTINRKEETEAGDEATAKRMLAQNRSKKRQWPMTR